MDPIPFVKVTFEEAQASFHSDVTQINTKPRPADDWTTFRNARQSDASELTEHAFSWLAVLPATIRPKSLPCQYPRIVNRVAELWNRPLQCERYLDDLLLDKRGDRKGFSPDVASEIVALKLHFLTTSNALHFDVWGNRIGSD